MYSEKKISLYKDIVKPKATFSRMLNLILLYGFLGFAIFMPDDSLKLKIMLFFAILIINIRTIISDGLKYHYYTFYAVIFPVCIMTISYLRYNSLSSAISGAYVCVYLVLIFVIHKYKFNYKIMLINVLTLLAVVIVIGALLDTFGVVSIYDNGIFTYLFNNGEAMIGKSSSFAFYYMIFFKTSSLLVVLLGYALFNKKTVLILISILALCFSGTRANVYISIAIILFYFYTCNRNIIFKSFVTLVLVGVAVTWGIEIYKFVENTFLIKASSDAVRSGHFYSILNCFVEEPLSLIMGMGFGSYFYSSGVGGSINASELAYLELLRQVGLIGFIPFMYFLLKPIKKLFIDNKKRWLFLSYIGYLIIAYTNPLLFSSTAFLLYILVNLEAETL